MQVALRHGSSGNLRLIETGWSWSIFLVAGFLGLSLFFRGLALRGTLMLTSGSCSWPCPPRSGRERGSAGVDSNCRRSGLVPVSGIPGKRPVGTAFRRLRLEFANPDNVETGIAAERWGI